MQQSNSEILMQIEKFSPLTCWKVGLHYGSCIHFEMNQRTQKKTQDGSIIEIGNCRLVIYARSWLIQKDKKTIVNSDSVSQENIGDLVENKFLKQNLLKIDFANEKLAIATFTSNLNVVLSVTMQKKDEDNLFHLTFPDESLFASNRKLGFYKSS